MSLDSTLTVVYGSFNGDPNKIQIGTWNDYLSKIHFKRVVQETGEVQTYDGVLFDLAVPVPIDLGVRTPDNPIPTTWAMAGTFKSNGVEENPDKAASGWGWCAYYVGP